MDDFYVIILYYFVFLLIGLSLLLPLFKKVTLQWAMIIFCGFLTLWLYSEILPGPVMTTHGAPPDAHYPSSADYHYGLLAEISIVCMCIWAVITVVLLVIKLVKYLRKAI